MMLLLYVAVRSTIFRERNGEGAMTMKTGSVVQQVLILVVIAMAATSCSTGGAQDKVREARIAGSWYPGKEQTLRQQLEEYFSNADPKEPKGKIRAIIAPHAGYVYSGQTAAYAYKPLRKGDYERVILLGVSHRLGGIPGGAITDATQWKTPLGEVVVDRQVCDELLKDKLFMSLPVNADMEHSLEIQLPFLQERLGDFKLVPIMVGDPDDDACRRMGALLKTIIDEQTLIVVSSDFTHYGAQFDYYPFRENVEENLKKLDMGAVEPIINADSKAFRDYMKKTGATICGRNPIAVLLSIIPEDMKGELVRYDTSGKMTGDFGSSVSYVAIRFCGDMKLLNMSERKTLLRLARDTLETFLSTKDVPDPTTGKHELTPLLKRKLGAFVTLTEQGKLRGCIGTIMGVTPLYESVMDNAIRASTQDPRFPPVTVAEAKKVHIEISVMNPTAGEMSPFQKVKDVSEIVIGRDGLLLKKGFSQGILLPQVPVEEKWDRDTFLQGICRKAGLPNGAWKDPQAELYRFSAQVFGE